MIDILSKENISFWRKVYLLCGNTPSDIPYELNEEYMSFDVLSRTYMIREGYIILKHGQSNQFTEKFRRDFLE